MADPRRCYYYPPISPSTGHLGSRFGVRPGRTSGHPTFHAGLDFSIGEARPGTVEVYAPCDAEIADLPLDAARRGPFAGYGNAVVLRAVGRDAGWWILLAHLHEHAPYLETFRERGLTVPAGVALGTVGKTSNEKFAGMHWHLHVEIRRTRPDGAAPFPGPYGPVEIPAGVSAVNIRRGFNVDPEAWFAERGIAFGYRGAIQLTKPTACVPSPLESKRRVVEALGIE